MKTTRKRSKKKRAFVSSGNVATLFQQALRCQHDGRIEEAIEAYRKALLLQPFHAEAWNNLAILYKRLGRLDEAITCYLRAIRSQPKIALLHYNYANALKSNGAVDQALDAYRRAISLAPEEPLLWQEFAFSFEGVSVKLLDSGLMKDLTRCLSIKGIHKEGLSPAACLVLQQLPEVVQLLELVVNGHTDILAKRIASGEIIPALTHSLLVNLMKALRLQDLELEKLFTRIRYLILFLFVHNMIGNEVKERLISFLFPLAYQCYLNEYIYFQGQDETLWLKDFIEQTESGLMHGKGVMTSDLALLAAYYPLYLLKSEKILRELSDRNQFSDCKELLDLQVDAPRRELALVEHIPTLTSVKDETSQLVRDQYERNPYPRWQESRYIHPMGGLGAHISSLFPYLPGSYVSNPPYPDILIAGCGTGKQAIECARSFPEARLLAIDLSGASLAYAMRKAEEMGVVNIDFMLADILELDQLQRAFDLVASVGVLHHLKNPLDGWRTLLGLVRPGGYMQIGLYSRLARQDLNQARAEIREKGLDSTVESIRRFRQSLFEREDKHMVDQLSKWVDFYSTSECRDLLFHVQEHQFTLPLIQEALNMLALDFLGFEIKPAALACFRRAFPEPSSLTDLMKWDQFEKENPETFKSMYQFWVRKAL